jgi:hypothetical protein
MADWVCSECGSANPETHTHCAMCGVRGVASVPGHALPGASTPTSAARTGAAAPDIPAPDIPAPGLSATGLSRWAVRADARVPG